MTMTLLFLNVKWCIAQIKEAVEVDIVIIVPWFLQVRSASVLKQNKSVESSSTCRAGVHHFKRQKTEIIGIKDKAASQSEIIAFFSQHLRRKFIFETQKIKVH